MLTRLAARSSIFDSRATSLNAQTPLLHCAFPLIRRGADRWRRDLPARKRRASRQRFHITYRLRARRVNPDDPLGAQNIKRSAAKRRILTPPLLARSGGAAPTRTMRGILPAWTGDKQHGVTARLMTWHAALARVSAVPRRFIRQQNGASRKIWTLRVGRATVCADDGMLELALRAISRSVAAPWFYAADRRRSGWRQRVVMVRMGVSGSAHHG